MKIKNLYNSTLKKIVLILITFIIVIIFSPFMLSSNDNVPAPNDLLTFKLFG